MTAVHMVQDPGPPTIPHLSDDKRESSAYVLETAFRKLQDQQRNAAVQSDVSPKTNDGGDVSPKQAVPALVTATECAQIPDKAEIVSYTGGKADNVLLLNNTHRGSTKSLPMQRRRSTRESIRQVPYQAGKHARLVPMESDSSSSSSSSSSSRPLQRHRSQSPASQKSVANNRHNVAPPSASIPKQRMTRSSTDLHVGSRRSTRVHADFISEGLTDLVASLDLQQPAQNSTSKQITNDGSLKRSESAAVEIQKMRQSLLQKREMRRKQKKFLDDDRVLVGNKVTEGHVNFIIAYNMLTGIRVAVSRCSGIMKPLTDKDFRLTKKLAFDYHGNELTPSSQYAFKFKDYCPEVFRELRAVFGLDPADYLISLTSKYILSELNSPGKSGSFFYFSRDYKYIIKTIHHSEHRHLRKILKRYYEHIKQNPDTLISQFYGLHRIKMPYSFRSKIKYRKIYFIVMNNLFPPHLQIHSTFDLKGSTLGRFTKYEKKEDPQYSPVYKDLNWLDMKEDIKFGPLKSKKFLQQLENDVHLLSELNIMDYSLLLGIHNIEKGNDLIDEDNKDDFVDVEDDTSAIRNNLASRNSKKSVHPHKKHHHRPHTHHSVSAPMNNTQVVKHFFQQDEGGIRASDQFNHDLNQIYFVGIIDCLTNYSLIKRMETLWRGINHDLKVVSAVPPNVYGERFYHFVESSVNKHYEDVPQQSENPDDQ
ncbi:unnamed protein product [Kluyveromyces dobzhanskii CBS 2104]|uniref:1-phosphatidylinositol-4-phosphate 5-kinase n=1 Tax=Kluyveromyces dobzhanskii CBS 2104 TaxID=1427455 RepID=A0A0A8L5N0_9SACH|nr:unnamed protein product [Kluyveromyces dobzhanskii CBS 2104]